MKLNSKIILMKNLSYLKFYDLYLVFISVLVFYSVLWMDWFAFVLFLFVVATQSDFIHIPLPFNSISLSPPPLNLNYQMNSICYSKTNYLLYSSYQSALHLRFPSHYFFIFKSLFSSWFIVFISLPLHLFFSSLILLHHHYFLYFSFFPQ